MLLPTLQEICTAIWTYPTRRLRTGTPPASPTTLLERICAAAWAQSERHLRFRGDLAVGDAARYAVTASDIGNSHG